MYIVIDKRNNQPQFGGDNFSSKSKANQAIVDAIRGAFLSKNAMKYFLYYGVRKAIK